MSVAASTNNTVSRVVGCLLCFTELWFGPCGFVACDIAVLCTEAICRSLWFGCSCIYVVYKLNLGKFIYVSQSCNKTFISIKTSYEYVGSSYSFYSEINRVGRNASNGIILTRNRSLWLPSTKSLEIWVLIEYSATLAAIELGKTFPSRSRHV